MRIVITKDGTKIIEDLSPYHRYNSETNIFNSQIINKKKLRNLQKNKSVNQIGIKNKNTKFHSNILNLIKNNSNKKSININEMLNNIKTNKYLKSLDKKRMNTLEIINLKSNRNLNFPKFFENKYLLNDQINTNDNKNDLVPDILLTINNSIDNEISDKTTNSMKRTKTINDVSANNSESNFNGNELQNEMTLNKNISLPKIRKSFPLKYIIDKESYNRLYKEMDKLEEDFYMEKKLFPNENNYLIKNNWEISKKNFDLSLKNEINSKNINLIKYLNKDKNISNIFLQKFSNFNNEKIEKLENISKKLLFKHKIDEQINKNIKNKLKSNLVDIDKKFRQSLNNINDKLNKYEVIIKKDEDKFSPIDKTNKNRYLEQFFYAEKNWEKYNLERYYKKSSYPKRSAYRKLLE